MNSRVGDLKDIISEIDSIPSRSTLDSVKNHHGYDFIEFLTESRFCMLNGLFRNDNFTSVSTKGRSVVNYICVPHDNSKQCKQFEVLQMQSIIDDRNLHGFIGERSRIPDHALLRTEVVISCMDFHDDQAPSNNFYEDIRYKVHKIPRDFIGNSLVGRALQELIDLIESSRETQIEIDTLYTSLCDIIIREMDSSVPKYGATKATNV